jgi:hypothetical protein
MAVVKEGEDYEAARVETGGVDEDLVGGRG